MGLLAGRVTSTRGVRGCEDDGCGDDGSGDDGRVIGLSFSTRGKPDGI